MQNMKVEKFITTWPLQKSGTTQFILLKFCTSIIQQGTKGLLLFKVQYNLIQSVNELEKYELLMKKKVLIQMGMY